jgi:AcrR family transcriptional regulator
LPILHLKRQTAIKAADEKASTKTGRKGHTEGRKAPREGSGSVGAIAAHARIGLRGSVVRNPEQREEQRRQILAAASRVFARKSYEGTTMDDIAAEMGGSKGILYYQFQSKQDVIVETRRETSGGATQRLKAIVALQCSVEDRMELALRDLIAANFQEMSRHVIVTPVTMGLDKVHAAKVRAIERGYEKLMIALLEEGVRKSVFVACNVNIMAFTLIRACLSPAWWYREGHKATESEVTDLVSGLLMRGLKLAMLG